MTGFDVRRKRPWWLGWLPAAVLVLAIAAVVIATLVFRTNGLGDPAPAPTVGEVTELNWSSFTEDGLAYIERSRDVRIDLDADHADAAALGLPAEGTVSIGPSNNDDTDNSYYLILNGGGDGHGGAKFTTSEVDVTTADGQITNVAAVAGQAEPFRIVLNALDKQLEEFGWTAPDRTALFEMVEQATNKGEPYEFSYGPGDRLGMSVTATAQCETSGYCLLRYDVAPVVR